MLCVLILGYRKGILQAAAKLGLKVILWEEKPVSARVSRLCHQVIVAPFGGEQITESPILQSLKQASLRAVLALKEKAVISAAALRHYFQLPGVDRSVAIRCHDKWVMKQYANQHQIPVTDFLLIDDHTHAEDLIARWDYPLVIKPRCSSGRRGLQIIHDGTPALPYHHLAERYISGDECSVESLIVDHQIQFTNITDYYRLMHANILPASYSSEKTSALLKLNQRIIELFQIPCGMTHIEFFYHNGQFIFGEIAIRPPGGYIMNCLEQAYETPIWEAYLRAELNLPSPGIHPKAHTAAWIVHPGAGTVTEIRGIEKLSDDPNIIDSKIRLKIGDEISPRLGVGEDVGRVILKAQSQQSLLSSLETIEAELQIDCQSVIQNRESS